MNTKDEIVLKNRKSDVSSRDIGLDERAIFFKDGYPYFRGKPNKIYRFLDSKTAVTSRPKLTTVDGGDRILIQSGDTLRQTFVSSVFGSSANVQSDWNETDPSEKAYIKNKDNVYSFTGADLSNRQIVVDNETGSEAPFLVLYKNGTRISESNFECFATTENIIITVNVKPESEDVFKYRVL